MPDYRRLVSYIYNYEDGIKRTNIGYARVEARNGQCKCTIHVTVPSLNGKELKAYMFHREGKGLRGVLIGNALIRNGVGELRLTTDPNRIMNSQYAITDISGIILMYTENKFLATIWDDSPLTMEMIHSLTNPAPVSRIQNEDKESIEDVVEAASMKEVVDEEIENDTSDDNQVVSEEIQEDTPLEIDGVSAEEESINLQEAQGSTNGEDHVSAESLAARQIEYVEDVTPPSSTSAGQENKPSGQQASQPEIHRQSPTQIEEHPLVNKLYTEFTRMYPFDSNEITWCVRIEPKDISLFPVDFWPLANNSFLLHGYYGHKHLIFAKVNTHPNSYILGVPGIFHNKERMMARMFGFENFKAVKASDRRIGEFGYWYLPIQLHG